MFIREKFSNKYFLISLAGATVLYFATSRIFQDFLYRDWTRPSNLFESFGYHFSWPEPWELPFYLVGFFLIPILAWAIDSLSERGYLKYILVIGVIGVAGFAVKKIGNADLADFGLYLNYVQEKGIGKALWLLLTKRIFVTRLILLASTAVFFWALLKKPKFDWFSNVKITLLWSKIEPFFLVLIAFLIFHPNLPVQDHHSNYFIGTVNDMLHGKPLLYETSHLYGLLNVYFLSFVFKFLLPFSYESLALILFVFFLAFFIGMYYFLKKWYGSPLFAGLSTLAIISLLFFFQTSPTRSAYYFPAMTPFRFWLYVPVLYLLYSYWKNHKPVLKNFAILLAVIAVFWNFESGASLAVATFATLAYFEKFQFKKMSGLAAKFLAYLVGLWGAISLLNLAVYKSFPNWSIFFKEAKPFSEGIGMTPLPMVGIFDLFVILYIGVGLWMVKNFREGKPLDPVLLFFTVYGVFSSLYYVGESTWQNLYLISVPPIVMAFYLIKNFAETRLARSTFYGLLAFTVVFLMVKVPVDLKNRDYSNPRHLAQVSEADRGLYEDAQYLRYNFPELQRIALLHLRDVRLLLYAGKVNLLDFYYLFNLYYEEDMARAVTKVKLEQPQYLFIGKDTNDQIDYFVSQIPEDYEKTDELNTLVILERKQQ